MDYIHSNQKAWEEAFDNRYAGWHADLVSRLHAETLPFLSPMLRQAILAMDLRGKTVAQLCCNNGREILSIVQHGAASGVGFDIAENMVAFAREAAEAAGIPCAFQACNVLEIGPRYTAAFDVVVFTIGAITWFHDLHALFAVAARCLRPGGTLVLNDFHPFVNMLPLPEEETFDPGDLNRVTYSYFRTEPWLEQNSGMYMTNHQNTATFTSFSHTMGAIISAVASAGLRVVSLAESDQDIGMTDVYEGKGMPLSYLLLAEKPANM